MCANYLIHSRFALLIFGLEDCPLFRVWETGRKDRSDPELMLRFTMPAQ